MAHFTKGAGTVLTPFGKNVYLRSTVGCKFESYTLAAVSVPAKTIDGVPGQKVLQPGTVMAKITSGPYAGKIGPFQAAGTAEVQTVTITGTPTGGTFTLTFNGETTAAIPYNATAAQVRTALEALSNVEVGDVTTSGGPLPGSAVNVTFGGNYQGDPPQMTANGAALTGGTSPAVAVSTSTPGTGGATDGRQTAANIVGILDTFLPWQTIERDVEVAVLYEGTVVQAWCFELNTAGDRVTLSNTTVDSLVGGAGTEPVFRSKRLDIKFA